MIAGFMRLDGWTRHFVPAGISFILLAVQFLPWGGVVGPIVPCLGVMSVFYWSARVPGAMPPYAALLLGCLSDLLAMTPLGSQGMVFLVIALLAKYRRRRVSSAAFLGLWAAFAVVCAGQQSFLWLCSAFMDWTFLPFGPILPQTLSSVLLFPVVTRFILLPAERVLNNHA